MKYDVLVSCTLPNGVRASGYLTAVPVEASNADVEELVSKIQEMSNTMNYLVLFTRDKNPITQTPGDCEFSPSEICLPGELARNSLILTQVIGIPDESAE